MKKIAFFEAYKAGYPLNIKKNIRHKITDVPHPVFIKICLFFFNPNTKLYFSKNFDNIPL